MSKRNAPRTRGNVKPTNSSRASTTLVAQGISPFTFLSGGISISNGMEEYGIDNELDPELRVILRKLTKKDSTTKIRAFTELRDYCEAEESDEKIRSILPFFVTQYRKWSIDSDQRVRDECQSTFDLIGMRMKKNLSPHLKTILPSWLMAQCDSYAPAASKARFLYNKLFPEATKLANVVYFARNEIMSTLADEISQCSDVLKDKKENEMETDDAHERRLTQALLALALFVNYFDPSKRHELTEHFKTIFDSGKFWKLDKIKSIQIQSSFYRCLHALISLIPDIISDYKAKIMPLVFYGINETEPKTSPLIWDCLILCLDKFDDCWTFVNCQKAFLPKLYAFLRSACHGNVFGMKDHLLRLMTRIPSTTFTEQTAHRFVENFFQSLEEGILSIKGRQQVNNVSSLLKAYVDCLIYILDHHSTDPLSFINERSLPLIRLFLTDKECSIRTVLPRQYLHLLNSLKSYRLYSDHLNRVLNQFRDLILSPNSSSEESIDLKYLFEQSNHFFETILFPPKMKNLRFALTPSSDCSTVDCQQSETTTNSNDDQEKDNFLVDFACDLCRVCFQFCIDLPAHPAFDNSLKFFTRLLNGSNADQNGVLEKLTKNQTAPTVPERFHYGFARPLIEIGIERHSSLDEIVELTVQILDKFQSSKTVVEQILDDLIQLESSRRFYFLLTSIVCRYETSPSFHIWLQAHGVLEQLLNMTASVSKSTEINQLNFPVSSEEFQLLSSLLCSSKPTQYLTEIQKDQIVYLACHLLEQQSLSLNDIDHTTDLVQSIDHVAKHLFQNIDQTYSRQSTKNLFELYVRRDLLNLIRKNSDLSLHHRSIWFIALEKSVKSRKELIDQVTEWLISHISTQYDNDLFIDALISIGSEQPSIADLLSEKLIERVKLSDELIRQSWTVPIIQGWLLPEQTLNSSSVQETFNENERLILVQFLCLLTIRQHESNYFLWPNEQFVRDLILNYYLFQSRCLEVKHFYPLFERLFRQSTFLYEFQVLDAFSDKNRMKFYSELLAYHLYSQIKERYVDLNHRDDLLNYTMILNNNDEINLHLFLASFFRESQLKLFLPHLIEQCQDERRSSLSLASLNQCLLRMNKLNLILDQSSLENILEILMKSSVSSKELIELIQLWNSFLNHGTVIEDRLKQEHWDHLLCLLGNLFQSLTDAKRQLRHQASLSTEILFLHSSNLLTTVGNYLTKHDEQSNESKNKDQLCEEWLLVHSKEIYQGLLPVYISLSNVFAEFSSSYVTNEMVKAICSGICTIPTDYLLTNNLLALLHSEDHRSTLPESVQTVFNHLYRVLFSTPNRSLQYSAYHLLNKLLPTFATTSIRSCDQNNDIAEDTQICYLPGSMTEALNRTADIIQKLSLESDIVEEHLLDEYGHEVVSRTAPTIVNRDQEHLIIGDLLNCKLLLNLISCYKKNEERYTYTLMLQEKKLVERFLSTVLGLIPANPVYNDPISMQVSSITKKFSHSKSMFENEIQLNPNGDLTSPFAIHHLACSVYIQCLASIPALVREWYQNQPRRIRDAVDRMTQKYVSPVLIQQEMEAVSSIKCAAQTNTGSFALKKHSTTREITAIYTIETSRVEICIRLPLNYPLTSVTIECTNHIGFTKEQWNQWILQLKMNLMQNNGAILNGLLRWKENVDKKLQGVEECSVCYCILHTNNQLPRRVCQTCKKKFHDACLFRWFQSSNKSTCPHCRANF